MLCNETAIKSAIQTKYRCAVDSYVKAYLTGESIYLAVGCPLHIYFVCLILKQSTLFVNFYAFNLAFCEILFAVTVVIGNSIYLLTDDHCLLYVVLPIYAFIFTARPLLQCLICVERYLAVVHPIVYLRYKVPKHKMLCTALVGAVVVVFAAEQARQTPRFLEFEFAILFVILLIIDVFCSLSVLCALKRPSPGESERANNRMNKMKRSAFKTITVILIITVADHAIVTVMGLAGDFSQDDWICILDIINTFVFTLCGLVQPLLYLQKMGKLPCAKAKSDSYESHELS